MVRWVTRRVVRRYVSGVGGRGVEIAGSPSGDVPTCICEAVHWCVSIINISLVVILYIGFDPKTQAYMTI